MAALLTPSRRRGVEILDSPDIDPALKTRSLADVARANALFGGLSSALYEIEQTIGDLPRCATLLDVGTGLGDIPCRARVLARENGVDLTTIGLDSALELTRASRPAVTFTVCGDALRLPFADRSVETSGAAGSRPRDYGSLHFPCDFMLLAATTASFPCCGVSHPRSCRIQSMKQLQRSRWCGSVVDSA